MGGSLLLIGAFVLATTAVSTQAAAAQPKAVKSAPPPRWDATGSVTQEAQSAIDVARRNADKAQADQFAALDPLPPVKGKPFHMEVKPTSFYRGGKLQLLVYANNIYPNESASFSSPNRFEKYPAVQYRRSSKGLGSYTGSNAYGVTAEVTISKVREDAILLVNREDDTFVYEAEMPGPEAKTLANSARLVIDGVISSDKQGHVAGCDDLHKSATIDSPSSISVQTCWAAVEIRRIAFVGPAGELREWTPDSPRSTILDLTVR